MLRGYNFNKSGENLREDLIRTRLGVMPNRSFQVKSVMSHQSVTIFMRGVTIICYNLVRVYNGVKVTIN